MRKKNPEFTIIIPAYNEESVIYEAVEDVRRHNPDALILAVDDGSTDRTGTILSSMGKKARITILNHAKNEGYGAALKHAFSHVKTPFVGFIDADLTYDPGQFPKLLEELKRWKLDCAWSNRFGGSVNEMPAIRKAGNRIINLGASLMTGRAVTDCTSGQRVFKTESLQLLDYDTLPDGPGFISALTKRTLTRGLKFATLPTDYRERGGVSKQKIISGFLRIIYDLTRER